jgi:tripartite-type tricarboxylate transporter receptor subunit TctC
VFAPRGTPPEIRTRFGQLVAAILREDANAAKLTEAQFDLRLNGPDELRNFVAGQMQTWGQVVQRHGIKGG